MRHLRLVLTAAIGLAAVPAVAAPVPIAKARPVAMVAGQEGIPADLPLAGSTGPTPRSILREVYPDLGRDGKGTSIMAVRALPDAVAEDQPRGAMEVDTGAYESFRGGPVWAATAGKDAFVMMAGVLIGAQLALHYRFLDALFVQTDPGGLPVMERAIEIAPGQAAVLIANRHYNSQEAFEEYRLIGYRHGALAELAVPIRLYSLSAAEGNCERKDIVQRLEGPTPAPGKPGQPVDLLLSVAETHECRTETGMRKMPGNRRYPIRWRWNPATEAYVGDSADLQAVNGQRMGG